ncbi:MAG TPA: hypothetical protein VI248_25585, partial [Kineosporiaceae bacterium]
LEPAVSPQGQHDVRPLARLLDQPLAASPRPSSQPVWHCSLRTAPGDSRLSDSEWREVAREVVHATGLAPDGDDGACRWVAVRHADDHIHLVVTLARQDGRPVRVSNDYYRVGEACRAAEQRLGLIRTAPRDRTATRRPTRGETEKTARRGAPEPARTQLRRAVRTAAATAGTGQEFLAGLEQAGLLVRVRHSDRVPGQVTGYAVALPGDRTASSRPVWFGGGSLASDLTWPKLAVRWPGSPTDTPRPRLSPSERTAIWREATATATQAARRLRHLADTDPAGAADLAHATGDLLAVAGHVVEGRRRGTLTAASDAFDRAARDLHGRPPLRTTAGSSLRTVARLLATTGRASRDETTQVLALVAELASLADAVAQLRDVQDRAAQAAAARVAASHLRHVLPPATPSPGPGLHTPRIPAPVHRAAPAPAMAPRTPRRVRA